MAKYIKIAEQYSKTPGGRWKKLGKFSGEEFYETLLLPKYREALSDGEKLIIYLDGARSYPNSFLDQSFGELARQKGVKEVRNRILFETDDFKWIVEYINKEIWDKL